MNSRELNIQPRRLMASFFLGHFANDWVAGTIWLLTPAIATALDLSPAEIGLLLTINGIGAGLAYIPAGIIADQVHYRGWLLLATFWWVAIGYFAASFSPNFWMLTGLLTLAVMGDAAWHPIATGLLMQRMPERRAQVLGIHAMGGTLGAEVFAPLTVGLLLTIVDWRTALQISVLPALIMGVLFIPIAARLLEPRLLHQTRFNWKELLKHWSGRDGLGLVALLILYNMSLIALLSMTPLLLHENYQLNPLQTAIIFASMLLAGSVLQPLVGHVSDRIGRQPVLLGSLVSGGVFALLVASQTQIILLIGALIMAAAILTGMRSVVLAAAVEFAGQRESTTLGITFALMDGLGAFGALFAGIAGSGDLNRAFIVAAGFAFGAALLATRLKFT